MNLKAWWASKTIWLQVIAVLIVVIQALQGQHWLNPEYQVAILAVLNIIVRLITNQGIGKPPASGGSTP